METASATWERPYDKGIEYIEHRSGVAWHDAARPRRWHHCQPQTRGMLLGSYVERCACGGLRYDGSGPWIERNTRTIK